MVSNAFDTVHGHRATAHTHVLTSRTAHAGTRASQLYLTSAPAAEH
jgi:hypothetical protein